MGPFSKHLKRRSDKANHFSVVEAELEAEAEALPEPVTLTPVVEPADNTEDEADTLDAITQVLSEPEEAAPAEPKPSAAPAAGLVLTTAAKAAPEPEPQPDPEPEPAKPVSSRVKTTFLGFSGMEGELFNMDELDAASDAEEPAKGGRRFPTGWLVIVKGPGKGSSFSLGLGVMSIGRGEDQAVSLDFGDMAVSREGHASIAFDEENRSFYLGHGGKSNIVRLNGKPLLSTEKVATGDQFQIGETHLRLVAFCGDDFSWSDA